MCNPGMGMFVLLCVRVHCCCVFVYPKASTVVDARLLTHTHTHTTPPHTHPRWMLFASCTGVGSSSCCAGHTHIWPQTHTHPPPHTPKVDAICQLHRCRLKLLLRWLRKGLIPPLGLVRLVDRCVCVRVCVCSAWPSLSDRQVCVCTCMCMLRLA